MNDKTSDVNGYVNLLKELKGTDSETGLLTRSNLTSKLMQELARSQRYGNKLSIVSLRVAEGADSGETATKLGNYLGLNVRNVDYAARWSEREFLVVLPETDADGARAFAGKIGPAVKELESAEGGVEIEVAAYAGGDDLAGLLSKVNLNR